MSPRTKHRIRSKAKMNLTWQVGLLGHIPLSRVTTSAQTFDADTGTSDELASSIRMAVSTLMMTCSWSSTLERAWSRVSRSVAVNNDELFMFGRANWKAAQNLERLLSPISNLDMITTLKNLETSARSKMSEGKQVRKKKHKTQQTPTKIPAEKYKSTHQTLPQKNRNINKTLTQPILD